jgi:N5-(cytidine 5'-diphosphoramidyl)-L-glutamine hydrolase
LKKILVTQRVEVIEEYGERRDSIDQKWLEFLSSCNLHPVIIPNNLNYVKELLATNKFSGALLTGGNSLIKYGGNSPERDLVEYFLLDWSIKNNKPLLGVCRGMQMIQDHFENKLEQIIGHINTKHSLQIHDEHKLTPLLRKLNHVNAFHEFGAKKATGDLVATASSNDGVVMAIEHKKYPIYGIMWHSEREQPFIRSEKEIFIKVFEL